LPREKAREQKAAALLHAAETLYLEGQKFSEVSVEALCERAGISRATFYIYFQDKAELISVLAEQVFSELESLGHKWWDVSEAYSFKTLCSTIRSILEAYASHAPIYKLVEETRGYDPVVSDLYKKFMSESVDSIQTALTRAQHGGFARKEATPEMATCLHWMVERVCSSHDHEMDDSDNTRYAEAISQIIWRSLYELD
jgi:AcrR family transcriptional regulator